LKSNILASPCLGVPEKIRSFRFNFKGFQQMLIIDYSASPCHITSQSVAKRYLRLLRFSPASKYQMVILFIFLIFQC
jgi:hypothetical protein